MDDNSSSSGSNTEHQDNLSTAESTDEDVSDTSLGSSPYQSDEEKIVNAFAQRPVLSYSSDETETNTLGTKIDVDPMRLSQEEQNNLFLCDSVTKEDIPECYIISKIQGEDRNVEVIQQRVGSLVGCLCGWSFLASSLLAFLDVEGYHKKSHTRLCDVCIVTDSQPLKLFTFTRGDSTPDHATSTSDHATSYNAKMARSMKCFMEKEIGVFLGVTHGVIDEATWKNADMFTVTVQQLEAEMRAKSFPNSLHMNRSLWMKVTSALCSLFGSATSKSLTTPHHTQFKNQSDKLDSNSSTSSSSMKTKESNVTMTESTEEGVSDTPHGSSPYESDKEKIADAFAQHTIRSYSSDETDSKTTGGKFAQQMASNTQNKSPSGTATGCLSQEHLSIRIDRLKEVFMKSYVFERTQQLLNTCNHVAICGGPGDGKTSIALMICEKYQITHRVLFVEDVEQFDVEEITKRHYNLLVVVDDIFGSVMFPSNLEKIHKLFRTLTGHLTDLQSCQMEKDKGEEGLTISNENTSKSSHDLTVIFTSRTYNWKEGCSRLFQYRHDLLKSAAVVDMTKECLSSIEKTNMMKSIRSKYQTCDLSEDIKRIAHAHTIMFGFPGTCSLFLSNPEFQSESIDFFQNPVTYLRGDLDAIIREGSSRSAALILLILCEGKLNLDTFLSEMEDNHEDLFQLVKKIVSTCSRSNVFSEINNFDGTYFTVENYIASFAHDSIYDAVGCALGSINVVLLLEHCSLRFLYERVTLFNGLQTETNNDRNMIYVTSRLAPRIVVRLAKGIRQGCFKWTVTHSMLSDGNLAYLLLEDLGDDLLQIVQERDNTTDNSFLYWASLSHYHIFAKALQAVCVHEDNIMSFSQRTTTDFYDCTKVCVQKGKLKPLRNIVELLKERGTFENNKFHSGRTHLMTASEAGQLDALTFLIKEGADILLKDDDNQDCLMLACDVGNVSVVKHLLSMKQFDINRRGGWYDQTPVMVAAERGHYDVFRFLVSEGADLSLIGDDNKDCLMLACEEGNVCIVKHLLMKQFNINRRGGWYNQSPVLVAVERGNNDVFNLLVSAGADLSVTGDDNRDCLMLACEGGNLSVVKHLLSMKQFDINRRGGWYDRTPVMVAAERGHYDVFQLLVSEEADLSGTDNNNTNCLMLACEGGSDLMVTHILSLKQFNINKGGGSFNHTAVNKAAERGHYGVFNLLVSAGADLSVTGDDNRDCLMLACEGGNLSIVKHLLSMKQFDINRRGGWYDRTPVMVAADKGHYDVFRFLVSEGADLSVTDCNNRDCLTLAYEGGNVSVVKHLLATEKKLC